MKVQTTSKDFSKNVRKKTDKLARQENNFTDCKTKDQWQIDNIPDSWSSLVSVADKLQSEDALDPRWLFTEHHWGENTQQDGTKQRCCDLEQPLVKIGWHKRHGEWRGNQEETAIWPFSYVNKPDKNLNGLF